MGVRRNQYARELERGIGKGKSLSRAQKVASMRSNVGAKPDKFDRPSAGDKIILGILRAFKGKGKSKKVVTTKRTSDIQNKLLNAGIDKATIARMRGKKKTK